MLRRIFSYMKEYKKYAWLALICIGVEVVLEIMVPKLMADLIDIGVTNSDVPYIINKGIQMAVCAVAALILGVGSARFSALAGQGLGANIRKAEYGKLQSYSFSNIDHFSVSSLVTRLTSDVTNIQNAVSTGMRPFGRSPVMLIFATTLAFRINSTLALVFLVALPILAVLLIIIIINVGPRYGRMQGAVDLVNRCIEENLTAVRVVKSYVRGDYEIEKFRNVNDNLKNESEKAFGIAVLNMIDITDENAKDIEVKKGEIEFNHVWFKYKDTAKEYVLSDVSFHINAGQTVGIIGQTGSSKTTLIQLIPRLYDASKGEIKIDGISIKEYPVRHLRDAISVVLQKNTLFSGSLIDNLRWGDENATLDEIKEACSIACVDEFIDRLPGGLDAEMGQEGVNVSGGQKQRICIARAILKKPKVLILDDSTSAVDTATEGKIRNALAKKLPDMTKIIIAQRISSVCHADQIIIMDGGRVDAIGTHESLLKTNKIYQEIYESQKEGADL